MVKKSETFRCKMCEQGTACEEVLPREEMGQGVERVDSFVYLGDCIDAGGGCRSAVTARVRSGWKKFSELGGILCAKDW